MSASSGISNANCLIQIGTIEAKMHNCHIQVENVCSRNSNELLLTAFQKANSIMDPSIQSNMAEIYRKITSDCSAYSSAAASMKFDLQIGDCYSETPLYLSFMNTGSAQSSCVMGQLLNMTIESLPPIPPPKELPFFFIPSLIVIFGLLCLYCFARYYKSYNILMKRVKIEDMIPNINIIMPESEV